MAQKKPAAIKHKPMSKAQYRAALDKLDISQARIAPHISVATRTSQGYALGETPIPGAVATLMRLLCGGVITVDDITEVNR